MVLKFICRQLKKFAQSHFVAITFTQSKLNEHLSDENILRVKFI